MHDTGWFADLSNEEDRDSRNPWQPFLQADGACFALPLRFQSKDDCEGFRQHILGAGMLA
ncbi:hypothetical protein [Streptomyces sp. NPDC003697]